LGVTRDNAEAAAVFGIEVGEVEAENVQFFPVDHHELAVIANEIAGRSSHIDAMFEQAHLKSAQILLAATIGIGDESVDKDATVYSADHGCFQFLAIKAEDRDFDPLFGSIHRLNESIYAVVRLFEKSHTIHIAS
jgi:hypothetical protein